MHPDLVRVVERAIQITTQDFWVQEGLGTRERQAALVARGASRTMHSRHLTGHAVMSVMLTSLPSLIKHKAVSHRTVVRRSSQQLNHAYVPFFGAFGAAWDDAMVARWSANPPWDALAGDRCVDVTPGDYFELVARQTSASTKNVAADELTWIAIEVVE